jgi:phenylacetate-CoA ligase
MGFGTLKAFKHLLDLKREQWMDQDSLEILQKHRLKGMLACASYTDHYGKIFENTSLTNEEIAEDLSVLPLTSKQDIIENPDAFISQNASKDSLTSIKTSGSTGMPIEIFTDSRDQNLRTAIPFMVETEYGRKPFDLHAKVHDTYFPNWALAKLGLYRRVHLSVFDSEEKNLAGLRKYGANILTGYTSAVAVMATLNQQDPLRMRYVACFGEILSRETREKIEQSFSCPVYDRYGSNEFGIVAWECPQEKNMHVVSSRFVLEIVDSRGNPADTGQIAITSLNNPAMPFIRYCIGDESSWGKECACGRGYPVLKSIKGRTDDYIVLPSGKVRTPFSLFCLYDIEGIHSYRVVQEREDLFVFRYVPADGGLSEASEKQVLERVNRACLGEKVKVEFEQVDEIEKGRTGKRRSVVSKVARPDPS